MKNVLLLGLLFSVNAQAADWLCTEESSQRTANVISSCGIGHGLDEGTARARALDSAQTEFDKICQNSSDCLNHSVTANPMRTECIKDQGVFQCYRLVKFTIFDQTENVPLKKDPRTKIPVYVQRSDADIYTEMDYDHQQNMKMSRMQNAQILKIIESSN